MKKVILIISMFILANCDLSIRPTAAQSTEFYAVYKKEQVTINGMDYLFIYATHQSSQTGYSITTINLTKDKLEVELLKKQLNK